MVESMEWLRMLIIQYPSFQYLLIFLGTALGGELALFVLGFFVAQGVLSIFPVVLLSFPGSFLPNILWFLLGKTSTIEKIASHRHTNSTFLIITEAVYRVSRGSHLLALILIKFLVGTPVLLIMYTHKTSMTFRYFIRYQSVAIFISMLIIIFVGYISGRGFLYLTEISQNLYTALGFLLFIAFIIVIFQIWLEKKFSGKI